MKKVFQLLLLISLAIIPLGCAQSPSSGTNSTEEQPVELLISAAASLTDALNDIKSSFEEQHTNVTITYNFGSSGKLAQMITQGAPSDIFLSASEKDMDTLQAQDLIVEETRKPLTENELVLIAHEENDVNISSFKDINPETIHHLSIGEPDSVPVGRYTKETLEQLDLWSSLENNLVYGSDVRQVLTHVELGNAEIGIVYASDAKVSSKVNVLATADSDWHEPIVYPGAVISDSSHREEAKQFLKFLSNEESTNILQQYGFK